MSKETYFFSHDCNARNDERILMLRADHGMEGYGIYWALIEMMFESSETCLYHDKLKGIAVSYNIDITKLKCTIDTCIQEGLFNSDGLTFWSESLLRRKEKYYTLINKRSDGGKKGMAKRWSKDLNTNTSDNLVITQLKDTNSGVITRDNKGKEIKGDKKKIDKDFIAPTLEQVKEYYDSQSMTFDFEWFHKYYEMLEWKNSKGKPVANWKLTMHTWEKREPVKPKEKTKEDQFLLAGDRVKAEVVMYNPFVGGGK